MNWNRIEGNWQQMVGRAREKWGELTDDELIQVQGNRERLSGLIQERYGIAQDEAERRIDDWAEGLQDLVAG
ncbi:MAG: CsbD family protein [Armatimonadota bacterium]|nr:CsbD family protein [Armatimonadota bacterium]